MTNLASSNKFVPVNAAVSCRDAEPASNAADGIVFVVDLNRKVRTAVSAVLSEAGYVVQTFCSESDFLAYARPDTAGCVILGAGIHSVDGLSLQHYLRSSKPAPSIVFVGERNVDAAIVASAMKAGAIDFLFSPCSSQILLAAVAQGLEHYRLYRVRAMCPTFAAQRNRTLTPRERQVMEW